MNTDNPAPDVVDHDTVPPANTGMLAVAGVLLLVPIVALMWVSSYAKKGPELGGFPFFYWYQMLWVIITPIFTWSAFVLVRKARPHRAMTGDTGVTR